MSPALALVAIDTSCSLQRRSGAHARNGRDPAVDQEVCPDDVRRIVRREVNRPLRDFQRLGQPLAWIVGSEDGLSCAAASPIPLLPPVIRIFLSASLPIVVTPLDL